MMPRLSGTGDQQCIDRRPPYVGYVCGPCPPGLHGNGRICTKLPKGSKCSISSRDNRTLLTVQ
ncbi:hypothetical protein Z043_115748 [Scleropages formosus]|uniref:Uncharacterized protein n=1 Tax=Scleropages formosus TaxID=113540 RepID=A0A0P7UV87_SCLFO|nr:hypothetical protein Z043_115748 [Scleropages formosus]